MEQINLTKWRSFSLRTLWASILCCSMFLSPIFETQAANKKKIALPIRKKGNLSGAGDGIRTRECQLGRLIRITQ